jgi:hypothetical protein
VRLDSNVHPRGMISFKIQDVSSFPAVSPLSPMSGYHMRGFPLPTARDLFQVSVL